MRFVAAKPECERLPCRSLRQKIFEVARIIQGRNTGRRRLQLELIEARTCGVMFPSCGLKVSRSPTLTGQPDEITGLLEQVGIDFEFGGKDAVVIDRLFQLP